MEKLLELYKKVIAIPSGCNMTSNQKSIVFAFIKEANKKTNQIYSLSVCKRKPVIQHVKTILTKHGLL